MDIAKQIEETNVLLDSLDKSMSYQEYRSLMAEMVLKKSTTGMEQREDLVEYTLLNEQRMKRWDKTIKVSAEAQNKIAAFGDHVTWLVLTESWCGDAAHVIPVINKVAQLNDKIDLRLVLRDDNDALMQQFLTNGGKSIPKLIMVDNPSKAVLDTFGPRPSGARILIEEYLAEHGAITEELKEMLKKWYNKDKGQGTIADLLVLLERS